jgi:hypothetical protein
MWNLLSLSERGEEFLDYEKRQYNYTTTNMWVMANFAGGESNRLQFYPNATEDPS